MKELFIAILVFFVSLLCINKVINHKNEQEDRQEQLITVYTPTDIYYADLTSLTIYSENSEAVYNFKTFEELSLKLEDLTAISNSYYGQTN